MNRQPRYETKTCCKVHAYGGVSKYGKTSLFVTMARSGIEAKSNVANGEVYLALLLERMIPARGALMTKGPIAKAQHVKWILKPDNGKACVCKKGRN